MNKPELFQRTVEILTNALQEGKLERSNCRACAVGNLIAANMYDGNQELVTKGLNWSDVFFTAGNRQRVDFTAYKGTAKQQIDSTGYSLADCCTIEHAFEMAPREASSHKTDMLNGLHAVYNVLCDIHEVVVEDMQPKAEEVFVYA